MFASLVTNGQKINKTKDEFTKKTITETEWYRVAGKGMSAFFSNIKVTDIDEAKFLDLKLMLNNKIFGINKGSELMLLLTNDSTITLTCLKGEVSSKGAVGYVGSAGYGTHTSYALTKEQAEMLSKHAIKKIRVYTQDGYVEKESHEDESKELSRAVKMLLQY